MDFISLDNVLENMAKFASVRECSEYPREERISSAAGLLHQILTNASEMRPRWVEINNITKRPVFNDIAIFPEGMSILEHAAGWFEREWNNHVAHISALNACIEQGLDTSLLVKGCDTNSGQYPRVKFLRPRAIGFERAELIAFFDRNQIEHTLKPQSPTPASDKSKANDAEDRQPSLLATRDQLIDCFGRFTGMDVSWFNNLKDVPKLASARKIVGKGGRGHIQEPMFCPLEVMYWLTDPKRRKGRPLSAEKAWKLLEQSFPKVYNKHSIGDPKTSDSAGQIDHTAGVSTSVWSGLQSATNRGS